MPRLVASSTRSAAAAGASGSSSSHDSALRPACLLGQDLRRLRSPDARAREDGVDFDSESFDTPRRLPEELAPARRERPQAVVGPALRVARLGNRVAHQEEIHRPAMRTREVELDERGLGARAPDARRRRHVVDRHPASTTSLETQAAALLGADLTREEPLDDLAMRAHECRVGRARRRARMISVSAASGRAPCAARSRDAAPGDRADGLHAANVRARDDPVDLEACQQIAHSSRLGAPDAVERAKAILRRGRQPLARTRMSEQKHSRLLAPKRDSRPSERSGQGDGRSCHRGPRAARCRARYERSERAESSVTQRASSTSCRNDELAADGLHAPVPHSLRTAPRVRVLRRGQLLAERAHEPASPPPPRAGRKPRRSRPALLCPSETTSRRTLGDARRAPRASSDPESRPLPPHGRHDSRACGTRSPPERIPGVGPVTPRLPAPAQLTLEEIVGGSLARLGARSAQTRTRFLATVES